LPFRRNANTGISPEWQFASGLLFDGQRQMANKGSMGMTLSAGHFSYPFTVILNIDTN
jgi:hypothetical protein